jgi:zinc transport system substrate-binding protein
MALTFAVLTCSACGGTGSEDAEVVAGFYPLAYAAERVAGETVSVRNLTPPGVEPHDFELSGRDVQAIGEADLVLYLGGGFQPALERAIATTGAPGIDLLEGLPLREGDPHVWLDPVLYAEVGLRIGRELGREARAEELAAELAELDREFRRGLADCDRRAVVTSHAAFGYLTARYELEQVAITGLSPEAEPAARDLEAVVTDVRERDATTVFFETLVSPRLAETVAREAGARTDVLDPLEGLAEDDAAAGADYFSVMRRNLEALRRGLGCR